MAIVQDAPIYAQLVAERGDVPEEARALAQRTRESLARVMPPSNASRETGPDAARHR